MNWVKYRTIIYSAFLIITSMLVGCGRESEKELANASLLVCADNEGKTYISDYQDAHITPDYRPLSTSFLLDSEKLYFVETTDASMQSIYEVSLQNSVGPTRLPIDLGGAAVKALAVDDADTEKVTLYCMAMYLPENGFLAAFSHDGRELWRKEFNDSLNQSLQQNEVFQLIRDGEGRFYALSMYSIFLFDNAGAYQGEVECPGKSFLGISQCGEEKVYVTYQGDDGQQPFLAEVQFQKQRLTEEKRILGNGSLYEGVDNTMLLCDSSAVYSCEPDSERVVRLFNLKDYNMISEEIQTLVQTSADEIIMVSWELLDQRSSVEIIKLKETVAGEGKEEKKIITLLCLEEFADELYGEIIADFNKQSKEYNVVIEGLSLSGITREDIFSSINTRLMAKESADLIYIFDYRDIKRYESKELLEDLTPYLEKSVTLKKEDYIEEVLKCFEVEGKLYGMSVTFCVDTLAGRASELGDAAGWTVEEFLDWLKQHPEAKGQEGLSQEVILEYCLKGDLDRYADWEKRKVLFEGESFKDLLTTIKSLDTDGNTYYDNWVQVIEQEAPILEQLYMGNFEGYAPYREAQYGEEMVYIGYPGTDGTPKYFFDTGCLSILSRSTCKEGAYAFWEYYMTHDKTAGRPYYTRKASYEASMQYALEEEIPINYDYDTGEYEWIPALTEKQKDKQIELFKYSVPDSLFNQTIRSIVIEEAQAYFQGDKTLDDTCRIIQSRVQLYLDENQ